MCTIMKIMVRPLLYPFTDRRSIWVLCTPVIFFLLYFVLWLLGLGSMLVAAYTHFPNLDRGAPPAVIVLWMGLFLVFFLFMMLSSFAYVGLLVAANREGWKQSGRLPEMRWRKMLLEGTVVALFSGVATLLPYYALAFVMVALASAVGSLSIRLEKVNSTLGKVIGFLGFGGVGLTLLAGGVAFVLTVNVLFPLLQARYAATGRLSSYFRVIWALRAISIAPGKFLLYQLPMLLFITIGSFLYVITLGLASIVLMPLFPCLQLNQAYLMGRYYGEVIDPSLMDLVAKDDTQA